MKPLSVYRQLTSLPYLSVYTGLIRGAMELDVFSRLTEPAAAEDLAVSAGWDKANTEVLLDALCSVGFLTKEGGMYVNTAETTQYLSSSSPDCASGFLQVYMQQFAEPVDFARLVREGPGPAAGEQTSRTFDFTQYGDTFRAAQLGCRQQEILRIVRSLPENSTIRTVLDIGCNTGLLGLAVIKDAPDRTGVLMDMPPLQTLIDESIAQEGLSGRVQSKGGNFLTDDIGGGYDLILAVSVMVFARDNMTAFLKKLYDALSPQGVILCIGEGIDYDHPKPWDMIMGYLTSRFRGADMAVRSGEIERAAGQAGFRDICTRTGLLCSGTQDIITLRK